MAANRLMTLCLYCLLHTDFCLANEHGSVIDLLCAFGNGRYTNTTYPLTVVS